MGSDAGYTCFKSPSLILDIREDLGQPEKKWSVLDLEKLEHSVGYNPLLDQPPEGLMYYRHTGSCQRNHLMGLSFKVLPFSLAAEPQLEF